MADTAFGFEFINRLVTRCEAHLQLTERLGGDGGPWLSLRDAEDPELDRGFLRLWAGETPVDRMVQVRLSGEAADTQLFFLFGRPETVQPHFHAQVVQFGPDACVYNADLLPRLDPVEHPGYYRAVFDPVSKAYWRATQNAENACASAPANPTIAAFLSPWSIGVGRPTNRAELERVGEHVHAYLEHWLALASHLDYPAPPPGQMIERDRRHLACFFDEQLDPRAWKGVYRLVGQEQGREIRRILIQNLSEQ